MKITPRKYWLVNIAIKLNQIKIRDANLSPSADKFAEEFARCTMSSLIDFFSIYNQVELNKESWYLTTDITPLDFMRMTTLAQDTINWTAQFVMIVFKILTPYLRDWDKFFLDNMGIKGSKTTCNNKKLVPGIRQYVIEYIQNRDKVLAHLDLVEVTIAEVKSQFCWTSIKIEGYIWDVDGHQPDTSKVIKILD